MRNVPNKHNVALKKQWQNNQKQNYGNYYMYTEHKLETGQLFTLNLRKKKLEEVFPNIEALLRRSKNLENQIFHKNFSKTAFQILAFFSQ